MSDAFDPARSELALLEVGRLALLGRLARSVVHEINNPLFVVLALAELMGRSAEPGTQAAERLAQVHEGGLEIRGLVGAVQELARGSVAAGPEVTAVAPLVAAAVDLVRRISLRRHLDIVERYDDEGALVLGRKEDLRIALLALLIDAQEATPEGGAIAVAVKRRGEAVAVAVRWTDAVRAPRLELLDRLVESIAGGHGGAVTWSTAPGGKSETVLSLPVVAG